MSALELLVRVVAYLGTLFIAIFGFTSMMFCIASGHYGLALASLVIVCFSTVFVVECH